MDVRYSYTLNVALGDSLQIFCKVDASEDGEDFAENFVHLPGEKYFDECNLTTGETPRFYRCDAAIDHQLDIVNTPVATQLVRFEAGEVYYFTS